MANKSYQSGNGYLDKIISFDAKSTKKKEKLLFNLLLSQIKTVNFFSFLKLIFN